MTTFGRTSSYLVKYCSIGDLTGRLVDVQKNHGHPLTGQFPPQPGPKVPSTSRHQHPLCGHTPAQCCVLARPGGHTLLAVAVSHHSSIGPVTDGHSWTGGNSRGRLVEPWLVGEIMPAVPTGLETTQGDIVARKLLHLAQRASTLTHTGTAKLHRHAGGLEGANIGTFSYVNSQHNTITNGKRILLLHHSIKCF